jgi:hypothetical protein
MDKQSEQGPDTELELESEQDAAEAEAEPSTGEPSWDQERYTARIEEPDWWTPEEAVWAEPEAASEPAAGELVPELREPTSAGDDEPDSPETAPVQPPEAAEEIAAAMSTAWSSVEPEAEAAGEPSAAIAAEREGLPVVGADEVVVAEESYRGEETMLWFGRRPAASAPERAESAGLPSDDAAGEMEVASTGRRGWVSSDGGSTGLPGGQELDEALAGFDALGGQPSGPAAEPTDPPTEVVEPAPQPPWLLAATPDAPPTDTGELRGPASRAYRRLRRIFPG